jgi:hypothetical protein
MEMSFNCLKEKLVCVEDFDEEEFKEEDEYCHIVQKLTFF